jgi:hypothetical protein
MVEIINGEVEIIGYTAEIAFDMLSYISAVLETEQSKEIDIIGHMVALAVYTNKTSVLSMLVDRLHESLKGIS